MSKTLREPIDIPKLSIEDFIIDSSATFHNQSIGKSKRKQLDEADSANIHRDGTFTAINNRDQHLDSDAAHRSDDAYNAGTPFFVLSRVNVLWLYTFF